MIASIRSFIDSVIAGPLQAAWYDGFLRGAVIVTLVALVIVVLRRR